MESPAFRTPCGGIELDEPELANMIAASMYPSNVRHLLISAAFLLTVAGPLSVFCGSEFRGMGGPPAAGLVSEVEDADVDQRRRHERSRLGTFGSDRPSRFDLVLLPSDLARRPHCLWTA